MITYIFHTTNLLLLARKNWSKFKNKASNYSLKTNGILVADRE